MIRIPVSALAAGMDLAAPVRHPGVGNHVLLNAGYRLEANAIASLKRFSVNAVWIRHPGFDFLDDKLGDAIPRSRTKLYHSMKRSFSGIANKTSGAFDLIEYRTVIGNMIISMVANKKHAVCAERLIDDDQDLFAHCANVAYLSLVIGMRIKDYIFAQRKYVNWRQGTDLTNLGLGAMLHDFGKLGLNKESQGLHFFDELANTNEYRSHAERGYRAVQGRIEATAAQVLLHHHQRFDGHGFPQLKPRYKGQTVKPMKGRNIHIFSRIVAVANAFDGVMSTYQKRDLPIVAALAALQQSVFNNMFDPTVFEAALRTIPPFPLGACVELSDGRQAVVTDLNESKPCQPKVGLLHSCSNQEATRCQELDLAVSCAPSIVRVGDQLVNENFYTLPKDSLLTNTRLW